MTTTTKILIGLFITTLWACSNSTTQTEESTMDKILADNYVSNISLVDGKFVIDTSAILNNNNLKSLISDLEKTDLDEKKTVAEIPSFIKSFLDSLTDNFSIANPDEDWQVGCVIIGKQIQKKVYDKNTGDTLIEITFDNSEPLPSRQLIYLGIGKNIALMTYYTGGIGKSEHIIIIKFDDEKIVDFWCGNILTDLTNKAEILKYLKDNKDKQWGLNTNIIYP
jgi:hypothetical protein